MKITYCTDDIHNSGGIEKIISDKSNYLANQGFEVFIIVINKTDKKPFFKFDSKVIFFYLNIELKKGNFLSKKKNFYINKELILKKISDTLKEIKTDITISTFGKYTQYIYEINDGSKKIIERHFAKYKRSQYYSKLDKYSLGRIITFLYRRKDYEVIKHFDKFIVLTEEDKKSWGNLPNIEIIENFTSLIPSKKASLDKKRVIALGRLNQQKQFEKLIDIWNNISKKYPDWKLTIFGDNNGKEKSLKKQINKLQLNDYVEIKPATKEVEKELLNSSIYVMTSKYEGFPLVLIEAMTFGLPVISFACKCGPRDIINDNEDGFLISFNNLKLFEEKLSLLIENDELRIKMGKAASKNIIRYSKDIIMKKWIDLFNRIIY